VQKCQICHPIACSQTWVPFILSSLAGRFVDEQSACHGNKMSWQRQTIFLLIMLLCYLVLFLFWWPDNNLMTTVLAASILMMLLQTNLIRNSSQGCPAMSFCRQIHSKPCFGHPNCYACQLRKLCNSLRVPVASTAHHCCSSSTWKLVWFHDRTMSPLETARDSSRMIHLGWFVLRDVSHLETKKKSALNW